MRRFFRFAYFIVPIAVVALVRLYYISRPRLLYPRASGECPTEQFANAFRDSLRRISGKEAQQLVAARKTFLKPIGDYTFAPWQVSETLNFDDTASYLVSEIDGQIPTMFPGYSNKYSVIFEISMRPNELVDSSGAAIVDLSAYKADFLNRAEPITYLGKVPPGWDFNLTNTEISCDYITYDSLAVVEGRLVARQVYE